MPAATNRYVPQAALALAQHGDMLVTSPQEVASLLAQSAGDVVR